MTLLNFDMRNFQFSQPLGSASSRQDMDLDEERPRKQWTAYALLVGECYLVSKSFAS